MEVEDRMSGGRLFHVLGAATLKARDAMAFYRSCDSQHDLVGRAPRPHRRVVDNKLRQVGRQLAEADLEGQRRHFVLDTILDTQTRHKIYFGLLNGPRCQSEDPSDWLFDGSNNA